jgi:pumilio homology domain family member 6
MAGVKRKQAGEAAAVKEGSKAKKIKAASAREPLPSRPLGNRNKQKQLDSEEELVESDTSEDQNGFYGFSANDEQDVEEEDDFGGFESDDEDGGVKLDEAKPEKKSSAKENEKEFRAKKKGLAKESG